MIRELLRALLARWLRPTESTGIVEATGTGTEIHRDISSDDIEPGGYVFPRDCYLYVVLPPNGETFELPVTAGTRLTVSVHRIASLYYDLHGCERREE